MTANPKKIELCGMLDGRVDSRGVHGGGGRPPEARQHMLDAYPSLPGNVQSGRRQHPGILSYGRHSDHLLLYRTAQSDQILAISSRIVVVGGPAVGFHRKGLALPQGGAGQR